MPVPPAGRPAAVPVATDRDGRAQGRLHGGREAGGRITIGAAAPEGGSPAGAAPRSSRMPPGELCKKRTQRVDRHRATSKSALEKEGKRK